MYIKIINIFLVVITFCFSFASSYWFDGDFLWSWKTIKELKENINFLDKKNNELNNDFAELNTDYKLKSFLKKRLSKLEFFKIKHIVFVYNTNKKEINNRLINNSKNNISIINERKELLEEKRKFYNWLIPYINSDFKNDYLEYIRRDAKIFNQQNVISSDIIIQKEKLNTKVNRIESEITRHKEYIKDSVNNIIESKIDWKINKLKTNKSFILLRNKSKIKVLDKTIKKIKIKLKYILI